MKYRKGSLRQVACRYAFSSVVFAGNTDLGLLGRKPREKTRYFEELVPGINVLVHVGHHDPFAGFLHHVQKFVVNNITTDGIYVVDLDNGNIGIVKPQFPVNVTNALFLDKKYVLNTLGKIMVYPMTYHAEVVGQDRCEPKCELHHVIYIVSIFVFQWT